MKMLNKSIKLWDKINLLPSVNNFIEHNAYQYGKLVLSNPVLNPLLYYDEFFINNLGITNEEFEKVMQFQLVLKDKKLESLSKITHNHLIGVDVIWELAKLNSQLNPYLPYVKLYEIKVCNLNSSSDTLFLYRFLLRRDQQLEKLKNVDEVLPLVLLNERRMMQEKVNQIFAGMK